MRALTSVLTTGLLAFCLLGSQDTQAQPRPYRITMLLYRGCEEACQGFQNYLRQQGVSVEYTLRDAAQDKQKIPGFLQEIRQAPTKPDLVLSWGTTVTQMAAGSWKDAQRPLPSNIPLVFMVVSDPISAGILERLDKPRPGLTGSLYLLPLETQLKAARSYLDFHRLGYVLNPSEDNSISTLNELRALARSMNFTLEVQELPLGPAGKPDAARLSSLIDQLAQARVDLIYQGPDSFLNSRREQFTDAALARGLPVFAAAEAPVQHARALFGVVNRYRDVGRYTGALALNILRDQMPAERIPVSLPRNFSYLINLPVALQLKRYPPLKLLDVAEMTGIDPRE